MDNEKYLREKERKGLEKLIEDLKDTALDLQVLFDHSYEKQTEEGRPGLLEAKDQKALEKLIED